MSWMSPFLGIDLSINRIWSLIGFHRDCESSGVGSGGSVHGGKSSRHEKARAAPFFAECILSVNQLYWLMRSAEETSFIGGKNGIFEKKIIPLFPITISFFSPPFPPPPSRGFSFRGSITAFFPGEKVYLPVSPALFFWRLPRNRFFQVNSFSGALHLLRGEGRLEVRSPPPGPGFFFGYFLMLSSCLR